MRKQLAIAHYFLGLPPLHSGGLPLYVQSIAEAQKRIGHKVVFIIPGAFFITWRNRKSKIKRYKSFGNIQSFLITNPLPLVFTGLYKLEYFWEARRKNNYFDFFRKEKIDILHIHSLIGLPKELVVEAKRAGVKVIFTTHDYYGICPKIHLFKFESQVCKDYKNGVECERCVERASLKDFVINNVARNVHLMRGSTALKLIKLIWKFCRFWSHFRLIKMFGKSTVQNSCCDKKLNDVPLHIDMNTQSESKFSRLRRFYLDFFNLFDLVLFNSELTMGVFSEYIHLSGRKCQVLPVAHSLILDNRSLVHYSLWKDGKINILFLGRSGNDKGLPFLFQCLRNLRAKFDNFRLLIAGNVEMEKFNADFVGYLGRYKQEDLPKIFSSASVVIVPSLWLETFGLVGLEALAYGIPVVVTENVGMKMFIKNGVNGFVVKTHELEHFLEKIFQEPEVLLRIRENILKTTAVYTFDQHLEELERVYEQIAEDVIT